MVQGSECEFSWSAPFPYLDIPCLIPAQRNGFVRNIGNRQEKIPGLFFYLFQFLVKGLYFIRNTFHLLKLRRGIGLFFFQLSDFL